MCLGLAKTMLSQSKGTVLARYLVTGGAGSIGSHLCDVFVGRGAQPVIFDDHSSLILGERGKRELGYRPSVGIADGPARTVASFTNA